MTTQKKYNFKIPYISKNNLALIASEFLEENNKDGTLPIPIELIADMCGVSIIPTKDLKSIWGIDAFITSSFSAIVIDQFSFENYEERARFTIAHELAHLILHRNVYRSLNINDENSYIDFQSNGDPKVKKRMEAQAYIFAGYVLMPKEQFKQDFNRLINSYGGLEHTTAEDFIYLSDELSSKYKVSGESLRRQIELEFPSAIKQIESLARI